MPINNESAYLPSESSVLPQGSWLIIAPHPDDETFGMGGSLLLAKAQDIIVDVIIMTDGSKGGHKQEALTHIREIEAQQAADILGIRNLYFWRETDRELTASEHLIKRLSNFIKETQPASVFFPAPLEPHPDHRTTAVIAWESLRATDFSATPISYDISTQSHTNCLIDISRVINDKKDLMAIYKSQLTENVYIERIIALNQARTWSLPQSVSHAESFYIWPKENRPLNALSFSLSTLDYSHHALPDVLPLVSVITRTQNRPDFLREAIRSVARQTYPNIELIVVNDGGVNCKAIVEEESVASIQQFHYQHLEKQKGRSHAANTGLDLSHGDFLIFLDDDDWFESHHIQALYEQLTLYKEAIAAYSAVRCLNAEGEVTRVFADDFDAIQLSIDNFIPIHAILFKRSVLAQGCAFDENLDLCEDWDFWLQVQQYGIFTFVAEIGANYRLLDTGSGVWGNPEKTKTAMLKVYKKWLPKYSSETLWSIFDYARYKHKIIILEQELSGREALIVAREQELNEKTDVIAEKNTVISQRDQLITAREQELNEKTDVIVNHEQKLNKTHLLLAEQQAFNTNLTLTINQLNDNTIQLQETIDSVYKSFSWKLTAPLRNIKKIAKGINSPMKKIAYSFWYRLPLDIDQRIKIKATTLNYFPIFNRFLGLSPRTDIQVEWSEIENIPELNLVDKTNKYQDEYDVRIDTAVNSTPLEYVPLAGDSIDNTRTQVKTIAFYLPQFHPIPENNREWGLGFTEWTNVSKANPQFVGHYQPRLPGELGYYDLRLKDVQQRQIELAKQYGIDGFCYHHYWFGGKRALEKPFQQILDDPSLDLPFCLCWANENWTRRWDGGEDDIILEQQHSPEDDLDFIVDIAPALRDKRYIRVNNKPLLIIYRPGLLPDPAATAKRWRQYAQENGIGDLHIVSAATFGFEDFASIGYDGLVQFPPHNTAASNITNKVNLLNKNYQGNVFDFKEFSENAMKAIKGHQHTFPCVMMNWDNEARKPGKGHAFYGASPHNYKLWLRNAFDFVLKNNVKEEQIVFINAWNEWAEGTYLEPDRHYGYAYLHATANVIREHYIEPNMSQLTKHNQAFKKSSHTAIILHLYYPDLTDELLAYIDSDGQVDYFINLPEHIDSAVINKLCTSDRNTYITISANKGRDILPFLNTLKQISSLGYNYVLKIHSKKTLYRKDGSKIRETLFNELLGKLSIPDIIKQFESNPKLGLIAPTGSLVSLSKPLYLQNNSKHVQDLVSRISHTSTELNFPFIAGSMFWARVEAIHPLLELNLNSTDFEEELGQSDGTMAHAVERIISFIATQGNYQTLSLDALIKYK